MIDAFSAYRSATWRGSARQYGTQRFHRFDCQPRSYKGVISYHRKNGSCALRPPAVWRYQDYCFAQPKPARSHFCRTRHNLQAAPPYTQPFRADPILRLRCNKGDIANRSITVNRQSRWNGHE
jgi:hypothetical protein